jgi:hypothetical protein
MAAAKQAPINQEFECLEQWHSREISGYAVVLYHLKRLVFITIGIMNFYLLTL